MCRQQFSGGRELSSLRLLHSVADRFVHFLRPAWLACAALLVLIATPTPSVVLGDTFTWDGLGTDDDWTTNQNWVGDFAPLTVGFHDIVLAGPVRLTPNVDTPFLINSLTLDASAFTFSLGGQQLTVDSGGITNESVFAQTINNNIELVADQAWTSIAGAPGAGSMTFNGNVDTNGFALELAGFGDTVTVNGGISGAGSVTTLGTTVWWLNREHIHRNDDRLWGA